ncbi:MAG: hypothetical protein Q9166_007738 [cf. Caloplaca sp. 2 TL-2023]
MDNIDDRPLAVRRKRRASSALVDPADKEATREQLDEQIVTQDAPCQQPKTPGNRKKKTRFSDSVVEIGQSSSTGLTPALSRTILLPDKSTEKDKKRFSLPAQLKIPATSNSSTESLLSASPFEVQFTPLRQKVDDRTMRRLKRNHLSETTNETYAEMRKSKAALQQEIEKLRNELALARQQENEAINAPDAAEMAKGDSARIAELEEELSNLKQEMREQSTTIDSSVPAALNRSSLIPPMPYERTPLSPPVPVEMGESNDIGSHSDNVIDLTGANDHSAVPTKSSSAKSVAEASTQTSPHSPAFLEALRSARLEWEHLFPGETMIGLEISDPEPFIQTMISRVELLKKEADSKMRKISVSETSAANMGKHFNNALSQLERHRTQIGVIKSMVEKEKDRTRTAELEISTLEAREEQMKSKCSNMEKTRDENRRSIERLQSALEHYQDEVTKLTRTILEMESSHEVAVANLRLEYETSNDTALAARKVSFDETISDLEAQIAAETTGRRKAEQSAVGRLEHIKHLENRQRELQAAVREKQSIIRELEVEIEQTKSSQEKEVGQLNVRIGELVSNLASANAELAAVRKEAENLSGLVEQEKAAGLMAVECMQIELKTCANKVDAVKDNHAEGVKKRGEAIAQSFGLITPVIEGGRFRDAECDEKVEGHVELMRGKKAKRPDSGVEIWGMTIDEEDDGDVLMKDHGLWTS